MLQTSANRQLESSDLVSPGEGLASLHDLIGRQYPVMIATVIAALALGALYLLVTPPSFTAYTLLMVDPPKVQVSLPQQPLQLDAASVSVNVDSQIPLIRSKAVALSVIKELDLTDNPEFTGPSGLIGWLVSPILDSLGLTKPRSERALTERALDNLERVLGVQRLGLTYVIQIDARSRSPELAAQIANSLATTYLNVQQNARYQSMRRASAWLQDSIKELSRHASDAERAVVEFKTRNDMSEHGQPRLRELESTAQTYRTLYESFLQRYGEAVEQQSFPTADATVISVADPPERRSHPQAGLAVGIAAFGGLLIGFGIAIWRDLSDRTFRTGSQLERVLRTKVLGYVPTLGFRRPWLGRNRKARVVDSHGPAWWLARSRPLHRGRYEAPTRDAPAKLQALSEALIALPRSRFADAIRSISLTIDFPTEGQGGTIVGITSALPGEGKSAIAVSLARLVARSGARTLLVDGDLHNPALSRMLAGDMDVGLTTVIAGASSLEKSLWHDSTGMHLLPAPARLAQDTFSNPFASAGARALFMTLRQSYDIIILDLPALVPLVDVRMTTSFVDTYLLVVEWGRTEVDVVLHALDTAKAVRDSLGGAIFNRTDFDRLKRYERCGSTLYNAKLLARYGYSG